MPAAAFFLFEKGELRIALEGQLRLMAEEVEKTPEDHVLQAEQEAWAEALAKRYRVEAPVLKVDEKWMESPQPVQVDVSGDSSRLIISRPALVPGHRTVVHIPFTGEKEVFLLRPSSFMYRLMQAQVHDGELRLVVEYPDDRPVSIAAEADAFIPRVEQMLAVSRTDITAYNEQLANRATELIIARKQRVKTHQEHLARTGLPIGPPRDPSKTYISDAITRLPAPALLTTPAGEPIELEPVMADELYELILRDIRRQTREMEKTPATYAAMPEMDLRNVILGMLKTNYATSTGESFNFGGKTDILITHGSRSIFIAELKFWKGQKSFTEALGQLFGYQAYRDTKLALLMFVKSRDVSDTIGKGRAALAAHKQFVDWQDYVEEGELRATVHWGGDERRHADLHVFFIPVPAE